MDPRLLDYYNRELRFIREMGGEFAREYPKIAGRLGLESFECADPYVERMLEGFAFLAARVQLKLDAEFPRFTQHLMESVYPHFLAPIPSMAVLQFQPDLSEGALAEGFVIPRHSVVRSVLGKGERTACEYRTAHDLTLWPLELTEVRYLHGSALAAVGGGIPRNAAAAIRLRLRTTAELTFDKLALEQLPIFLRGSDELRIQVYEQLLGHTLGVIAQPVGHPPPWRVTLKKDSIRRMGFSDDEALLPYSPRSFQGYRLLQEYFAFPDRYLFVELGGLGPAVKRCQGNQLELMVLLDEHDQALEDAFDASLFALFCSPAVNLSVKRCDRIHISDRSDELHVVPDRTRPMDYEVHSILEVTGFGSRIEPEQSFQPFYAPHEWLNSGEHRAFYTVHREPRVLSSEQRLQGTRSSYVGGEVFIALVDADEAPYRSDLRQLGVSALCTNRDLPLQLSLGKAETDFVMIAGAPVRSVRAVAGPTRPRPSFPEGETGWRLVSHLSLNYLSLSDSNPRQGAAALRELLGLYGELSDPAIRQQVDGVRSIHSRPITRRLPGPGPTTFARGLELTLELDKGAFEGSGVFLLGAVLEEFFSKYVSINSFTETIVRSSDGEEVKRWPTRIGRRHRL
ncbi:MAG: type VI secretion system baseplate subunit TssF [Chromatiaceae bacterium]|nr:type VI secretion system baseplate subunit TssF [Chromatiaceae bacterium]